MIDDIKPLLDIPTYSFYIFISILSLIAVFICFASYILIRVYKSNKKRKYIKLLKEIDLTKTKEAAYAITLYGKEVVKTDEQIKEYEKLAKLCNGYKYRKMVDDFDEVLIEQFRLFLKGVS